MDQTEAGPTDVASAPRRWYADRLLAGLAAVGALVVAALAFEVLDAIGRIRLFWAVQPIMDTLLVLLSLGILRNRALTRPQRRFFGSLVFMGVMFTIGDGFQTTMVLRAVEPTVSPGLFQSVCFIIGAVPPLLSMTLYPTVAASRRQRYRFVLDAGTVLVGAVGLVWAVTVRSPSDIAAVVLVAGVALAVTFLGLKLLRAPSPPFGSTATMFCAAATAIQGTGVLLSGLAGGAPGLLLAFMVLSSFLLPAGLRLQQQANKLGTEAPAHGGEVPAGSKASSGYRGFTMLPYLAMAAADGALLVVLSHRADLRVWGVVVSIIAISTLVALRQIDHLTESSQRTDVLEGRERWVNALLRHSAEITLVVDGAGLITYASPSLLAVLGRHPDEVIGHPADQQIHPSDMAGYRKRAGGSISGPAIVRMRHADGSWRWMEVAMTDLLDDPLVRGIVCNARDVTDARRLNDRLRHQATHDSLTGLPNRVLFGERMEAAIGGRLALLLIDLDGFKAINDTYGHPAGDALLQAVAERLRRCVRPEDTPARLGGDEFAVVLPETSRDEAQHVADRLTALLDETVAVDGTLLTIGASIGIATSHGGHPEQLMREADTAMYAAKRNRADSLSAGG